MHARLPGRRGIRRRLLPMRRDLGIPELGDLLDQPLLATLATFRSDGSVLLSPVWHEFRDGGFNICSQSADVKVRHITKDPRAVLLVAEPVPPYRGVELTTHATIITSETKQTVERVSTRYLGLEAGRAYAQSTGDNLVIRLEPGRVRAWDFRDDFGG